MITHLWALKAFLIITRIHRSTSKKKNIILFATFFISIYLILFCSITIMILWHSNNIYKYPINTLCFFLCLSCYQITSYTTFIIHLSSLPISLGMSTKCGCTQIITICSTCRKAARHVWLSSILFWILIVLITLHLFFLYSFKGFCQHMECGWNCTRRRIEYGWFVGDLQQAFWHLCPWVLSSSQLQDFCHTCFEIFQELILKPKSIQF